MHELVAQDVQPVENDGQDNTGFTAHDRFHGGLHTQIKLSFPAVAGVVLPQCPPERLEDEFVTDERPDRACKLLEQERTQPVAGVYRQELGEELPELLPGTLFETELAGVGGIEGDPQEYELGILVF